MEYGGQWRWELGFMTISVTTPETFEFILMGSSEGTGQSRTSYYRKFLVAGVVAAGIFADSLLPNDQKLFNGSMDINSQSETRTPSTVNSKENLITPNRDTVTINISQLEARPLCRICYSSSENLIRPCECRGTIEYVHRHCLERWLEEKNNDSCDLCQHQFQTRRSKKSLRQMLGDSVMRKYVIVYCTFMAIVISPFIAAAWMFWISTEAFVYYIQKYGLTLYTASGFFLPFALGVGVIACFSMILLFTRDFLIEFKDWRERNWNIQIVDRLPPGETNDSNVDNPKGPTHDMTAFTERPRVTYVRDMNGGEYVTIVSATLPENDITRQDFERHRESDGQIV